jgi:hypothetical protein
VLNAVAAIPDGARSAGDLAVLDREEVVPDGRLDCRVDIEFADEDGETGPTNGKTSPS